jgi:Plavaka transposase
MDCIDSLYGNPEFASHLAFAPERHYSDANKTHRVYHDMYTGKWWWETQVHITLRFGLLEI